MTERCPARPLETDRPTPFDPPAGLRARPPLSRLAYPDGHVGWVATGYDEVRAILADPRFSVRRDLLHQPVGGDRARQPLTPAEPGIFPHFDPPEHTRYRRLLGPHFGPRAVARLTPAIHRYAAAALDALTAAGPPADLVAGYAVPVPALVICDVLGVPPEHRGPVQAATAVMNDLESTPDAAVAAVLSIQATVRDLVTGPPPGDGLLARAAADGLSTEELTNLGMVLLATGHLPTSSMIALGAFALLDDTRRRDALLAHPERTVEELLRWLTVLQFDVRRTALADVPVGGHTVAAGETVVLALPVANRDPARFPAPDTVDPARPAAPHLAFGHGVHQCLGQHLARAELRVALTELVTRLPGLRLAVPAGRVPVRERAAVYGVDRLPVAW